MNLKQIIGGAAVVATTLTTGLTMKYADPDVPERTGVCWADSAARMGFVREEGDNEGEWVEAFQATTMTPPGSAWCGSFVYWSMAQCGKAPEGDPSRFAWVPNWFPKERIVKQPRVGDVFGLYFASKGRLAHVGIVVQVNDDGSVVTAEGNTNYLGSRDGSGCHLRLRVPTSMDRFARW